VSKHKYEDKYLVYGMRSQLPDGQRKSVVAIEVYEVLAIEDAVQPTLVKLAEYCGLSGLVDSVK